MPGLDSPSLNHRIEPMRPVSRCLDIREKQSVTRCLASILLAFDIGMRLFLSEIKSELFSCRTGCQRGTLLPSSFDFDDAPVYLEASFFAI